MTTIESRKNDILQQLKRLADRPEDKYRLLIEFGRSLPPMAANRKLPNFLVPGCMSQVWLFPHMDESGNLHFDADSDAQIPKGMIGLLLHIYSGHTPAEILALDSSFLDELGLKDQLSLNRRNSLSNFVKQIRIYAEAFARS